MPIAGRPLLLRTGGQRESFCCAGCYLVLQVTRERGPGGEAQGVMLRLGLAMFFAMNAMMFSLPTYFPYVYGMDDGGAPFLTVLRVMAMALTLPVLLLLGVPVLWQGLAQVLHGTLRTDALVALGSFAAYGVSVHHTWTDAPHVYFDSVAILLVFVTLGRYLEARGKASASDTLAALRPACSPRAVVERDGATCAIDLHALRVDDLVCLSPGDVSPVDGTVVDGCARFDESTLTGEGVPQLKNVGAQVVAGSTALDGVVRVRAERIGDDNTVSRLTRLVDDALDDRPAIQRMADSLAAILLVLVPFLAAGTFIYWFTYHSFDQALTNVLAVLVVACPCAMGIATPAALWVGIGVAARRHILVRGAAVLEALSRVRTVWFDKTGTLSTGRLDLIEVRQREGRSRDEIISAARALERAIPHPIAAALGAPGTPSVEADLPASDVRYHAGLGVEGNYSGRHWCIGSPAFLWQLGIDVPAWVTAKQTSHDHDSLVTLVADRCDAISRLEVCGALIFTDRPRREAQDTMQRLHAMGIYVGVLSGGTVAGPEWHALLDAVPAYTGLLPAGKVSWVRDPAWPRPVAMVGDGLNDAPALASADVGIAMGTGRDLVRESAQVSILSNDLSAVPWLLDWSRRVRRTVRQNLAWSVLYNCAALGAAVTGWLNPVIAAAAMIGSSLFTIVNTRRLAQTANVEPAPSSGAAHATTVMAKA